MMMTDAYIRRHTQNDKFTDYRSIPGSGRTPYKIMRRRNTIIMSALMVILIVIGIHDRIKQHQAEQEELY